MVFKDRDHEGGGYNIADSVTDALSPMNILKRIFLFIVFGILLALKTLVQNLDKVGRAGGGIFAYIKAITGAMWQGVWLALGSMWSVIIHPNLYLQSHSYGSIAFAIFSMIVLIMFFYQPVSLAINILDGKKGHATGIALRIFVTFVIVIILSCIVYYAGAGDTITSALPTINDTVSQNVTQVAQNLTDTGGSVVNLL